MIYENRESPELEKKAQKTTGETYEPSQIDTSILKTFDYEYPQNKISVEHATEEFTSVCPYSGLPDFGIITIIYTPNKKCIELKSLKYYLYAYRNVKIFNEHAVNKILQDLVKIVNPAEMTIVGDFTSRGGITNRVTACYKE
jgi:7-cyano-7-deazaguanine reductase